MPCWVWLRLRCGRPEPVYDLTERLLDTTTWDSLHVRREAEPVGDLGRMRPLCSWLYYSRISSVCRERRRCDCQSLGRGGLQFPIRWRLKETGSLKDNRG